MRMSMWASEPEDGGAIGPQEALEPGTWMRSAPSLPGHSARVCPSDLFLSLLLQNRMTGNTANSISWAFHLTASAPRRTPSWISLSFKPNIPGKRCINSAWNRYHLCTNQDWMWISIMLFKTKNNCGNCVCVVYKLLCKEVLLLTFSIWLFLWSQDLKRPLINCSTYLAD